MEHSVGSTIPRLYKLSYLETALLEISRGASFERIRQTLISFARTPDERGGTSIAPRAGDQYTFWSPTQEALTELMRLLFVTPAPVPASRQYVDAHRGNTYELTEKGIQAVEELSAGGAKAKAAFFDVLTLTLYDAHPGFADLLSVADKYPLCVPEYTVERIASLIAEGGATKRLAEDAMSRMTSHWPQGSAKPSYEELEEWIQKGLDRRFPKNRVNRPSQKDILDTVDAAILGFVAKARGIRLDPISFNVCVSWAGQLAVLEESRYVEEWPGRTIWTTATVSTEMVRRLGLKDIGDQVALELRNGFRKVAEGMPEARASGSLPIYRVRAQAAFASKVNLKFVDIILRRILSDEMKVPYKVQVGLGRGTPPPRSEPAFTFGGRRFLDMMIIETE